MCYMNKFDLDLNKWPFGTFVERQFKTSCPFWLDQSGQMLISGLNSPKFCSECKLICGSFKVKQLSWICSFEQIQSGLHVSEHLWGQFSTPRLAVACFWNLILHGLTINEYTAAWPWPFGQKCWIIDSCLKLQRLTESTLLKVTL